MNQRFHHLKWVRRRVIRYLGLAVQVELPLIASQDLWLLLGRQLGAKEAASALVPEAEAGGSMWLDHSPEYSIIGGRVEKGLWRIIQGGKAWVYSPRHLIKHLGRQERHFIYY